MNLKRIFSLSLLLALALSLCACTGGGDGVTNVPPEQGPSLIERMSSYDVVASWNFGNGKPKAVAIDGETAWIGVGPNGRFHLIALDLATGNLLHSFYVGEPVDVLPVGNTVWVMVDDGWLLAYDKTTGDFLGRHYVNYGYNLSSDGTSLYFISDGKLVRYNPQTRNKEILPTKNGVSNYLVADGKIYSAGNVSGGGKALSVMDLATLQETKIATQGELSTGGKMFLRDNVLYFGSCSVNLTDGTVQPLPCEGKVLSVAGDVLVTTACAYDLAAGKVLLECKYDAVDAAISANGRLVLATEHGSLRGVHVLFDQGTPVIPGIESQTVPERDDTPAAAANPFASYRNRKTYELGEHSLSATKTDGTYLYASENNGFLENASRFYKLSATGNILKTLTFTGTSVTNFSVVGDELHLLLGGKKIEIYNAADLTLKRSLDLPIEAASNFILVGDYVFYSGKNNDDVARYNVKTGETKTVLERGTKSNFYADTETGRLYVAEYGNTAAALYCFDMETLEEIARMDDFGIGNVVGGGAQVYCFGDVLYAGHYSFDKNTLQPLCYYGSYITFVSDKYVLTANDVFDRATDRRYESLPQGGLITNSYHGGLVLKDGTLVQAGGQDIVVWKP